jgi:hypothetical protein
MCRCLYYNMTYIPSGVSLGVELLDHMEVLFLVFWGTCILFSTVLVVLICIHSSSVWGFLFLHSHQHLLLFLFLMVAILAGVKQNINMVLICIFFVPRDFEHFFMYFFKGLFPLKKLFSVHLSTSSLGHWFLMRNFIILLRITCMG